VKSLTSLWSCTADELAVRCCTSATRDKTTVARRAEHEGLWFLAVTLADFGKTIERWLDQGFVVPSDAPGFKVKPGRRNGCLPEFMGGFLGRVFDPRCGILLDQPDVEAIYAIRQLTLMFSKIALPEDPSQGTSSAQQPVRVVSAKREREAMSGYIQCEHDVRASDERLDPSDMEDFKRMSEMLFGDLFAKVDRDVHWGRMIPKHGPGSVADKLTSNGKWNQRSWPARLQRYFPAEEYLIPGFRFSAELKDELNIVEPGAELPVKVKTVPKTLKTPRIIAMEPTATMYCQQAVLRSILDSFSEDSFLSRVIGFDDQTPNRELARWGSLRGDLATLDLSEASDRVSNKHVVAMLQNYPQLHGAVQAARSTKAYVPGHGVIPLAKFASMGSALCFPFEAMVFLTVIFLGIQRELGIPLSKRTLIKRFSRQVRVFGDDIVVPRDFVLSVCDELELYGFVVNTGKSFWTGRYRESCGREYFDGQDVSIVKVRRVLPTTRLDANGVIAAVSLRNQFYWSGLWKSAAWMDNLIRKLIHHFPNVAPSSPLLGRETALGYQFQSLDPNTHSPIAKGWYVRAKPPRDPLEGSGALLKCLLRFPRSTLPYRQDDINGYSPFGVANVDSEHLEHSGRPKRVSIVLGKRSPF
jgi:hypothetical protein